MGILNASISENLEILPGVILNGNFLYAINTTKDEVSSQVLDVDPETGEVLGLKDIVLMNKYAGELWRRNTSG